MPLLSTLLNPTTSPLLNTLIPTALLSLTLQTASALPSISLRTEKYYDLSGSLTHLACTVLSLSLPYLRARASGANPAILGLRAYLLAPRPGQDFWFWRQALLSAAVGIWAVRCM